MTRSRLDVTARQRALRRLAVMHPDEYADLLASERIKAGLAPEAHERELNPRDGTGRFTHRAHDTAGQEPAR